MGFEILGLENNRPRSFKAQCHCLTIFIEEESPGSRDDGFDYTVDLVKLIKTEFGDDFTVGVVGKLVDQSEGLLIIHELGLGHRGN